MSETTTTEADVNDDDLFGQYDPSADALLDALKCIHRALSLCPTCKGLPETSIMRCEMCACLGAAL